MQRHYSAHFLSDFHRSISVLFNETWKSPSYLNGKLSAQCLHPFDGGLSTSYIELKNHQFFCCARSIRIEFIIFLCTWFGRSAEMFNYGTQIVFMYLRRVCHDTRYDAPAKVRVWWKSHNVAHPQEEKLIKIFQASSLGPRDGLYAIRGNFLRAISRKWKINVVNPLGIYEIMHEEGSWRCHKRSN